MKMVIQIKYKKTGAIEEVEDYEAARKKVREIFPDATTGGIIYMESVKKHKVVATLTEIYR